MVYASILNPKVSSILPSVLVLGVLLILKKSFGLDSDTVIKKIGLGASDHNLGLIELAIKEICISIEFVKRNSFIGISSKFSEDTLKEFVVN